MLDDCRPGNRQAMLDSSAAEPFGVTEELTAMRPHRTNRSRDEQRHQRALRYGYLSRETVDEEVRRRATTPVRRRDTVDRAFRSPDPRRQRERDREAAEVGDDAPDDDEGEELDDWELEGLDCLPDRWPPDCDECEAADDDCHDIPSSAACVGHLRKTGA